MDGGREQQYGTTEYGSVILARLRSLGKTRYLRSVRCTIYQSLTVLVFGKDAKAVLAEHEDVQVLVFDPSDEKALVLAMEQVDTCMLVPPARKDKAKITRTLLEATKKAQTVTNMVFLRRLREFIDPLAMQPKSDCW